MPTKGLTSPPTYATEDGRRMYVFIDMQTDTLCHCWSFEASGRQWFEALDVEIKWVHKIWEPVWENVYFSEPPMK